MANNKKDWRAFLNVLAFASVALIGVSLFVSMLFNGSLGILTTIGQVFAYLITTIAAWYFVSNKKNVWLWVTYFVSIALIIISIVVPLLPTAAA